MARLMILFAAILAGCGTSDPYRETVEKHLSENLDDPDFEVVRWWPAKPVPQYRTALVQRYDRQLKRMEELKGGEVNDADRVAKKWREEAAASTPPTMARLKYRGKNMMGAKVLTDQLFKFDEEGKIERVIGPDDPDEVNQAIWEIRDEIFPE